MLSKISFEILVLFAISSAVLCASVAKNSADISSEINVLSKVYDDCEAKEDFGACLKAKAATAFSRATEQDSISIIDGISLVKSETVDNTPVIADARALSGMNEVDKNLIQNVEKFLKSHTLKVDLSEARGKGKKQYRYVIAAVLTAMGIAGPLGLKVLAFIAGKALVISKVALTIAGIIALKKIFSHDHHEETSFQVHAGSDHNRRNAYLLKKAAQQYGSADPYSYYYQQQAAAASV